MEGPSSKSSAATTPPPPSPGASGLKEPKPYDEQFLKQLVVQRDWNSVEQQLQQILPMKGKGQHPDLFLPIYREWIADLVRKNDITGAFKIFVDKVAGIYKAQGEFVADQEELKAQVNDLHLIATEKVELTYAPTGAEKMCTNLIDYLDLYFPLLTGHDMACEGYIHLWYFAKRMDKPKKQKDPNFRCLACGTEFKNCTISKMRNHLGERICEKLTENMLRRFNDGESNKNIAKKQGGYGESAGTSKQVEKGRRGKQNLSIAEPTDNIGSLADEVCASIQMLHAASIGKVLDPEVEARLKSAKDLLNEIAP